MADLPPPLVPADCDLRDHPRFPVDVQRLFASEFNATASSTPLAWMAGHKLWYRSWHQQPAGSLPDDDAQLCHLAELGFDLRTWRKIKALALRGWTKCSDGRLYHAVTAEAVLSVWLDRLHQRRLSGLGNQTRHGTPFDVDASDAAIEQATSLLRAINPHAGALTKSRRRPHKGAGGSPGGDPWDDPDARPGGTPSGTPGGTSHGTSREASPRVSQGEGKGEGEYTSGGKPPSVRESASSALHPYQENHPPPDPEKVVALPARARPRPVEDRGTRLPADWAPRDSDLAVGSQHGLTWDDLQLEIAKFRDYWAAKPGKDGRKSDWDGTFRNWLRNVRPARTSAARAGSRPTSMDLALAGLERDEDGRLIRD